MANGGSFKINDTPGFYILSSCAHTMEMLMENTLMTANSVYFSELNSYEPVGQWEPVHH